MAGDDGKGDIDPLDERLEISVDTHDKLDEVFRMQEAFMHVLQKRDGTDVMPAWPVDLTKKSSQQLCKSLAFDSMGELFEAVQHLKNSKPHRKTEIKEFDRESFKEELIDAFKYFLELLIFAGVTPTEFFEAYVKKDAVIHKRVTGGY